MQAFTAAMNGLRRLERLSLGVLLLVMTGLVFTGVVVRGVSSMSGALLAWTDGAALMLLTWLVFLGLGLALERRRHVAMTALFDRLPQRIARPVGVAINLVGLGFALLMGWFGLRLTLFVAASGQTSPALDVSMAWLYAPLPIGFGLLALRYAIDLAGLGNRFALRDASHDA